MRFVRTVKLSAQAFKDLTSLLRMVFGAHPEKTAHCQRSTRKLITGQLAAGTHADSQRALGEPLVLVTAAIPRLKHETTI
jgi:hypothetical protein